MLKEVTKSTKEITYFLIDNLLLPLFPRRRRRLMWADLLPAKREKVLVKNQGSTTSDETHSSLGWGCTMYMGHTRSAKFVTPIIDGIEFREFMPSHIRKWYGITELDALKIQSLDLNEAKTEKVADYIREI